MINLTYRGISYLKDKRGNIMLDTRYNREILRDREQNASKRKIKK